MKDAEIAKVKRKAQYDDNLNDWIIPPFILRGKEVNLPQMKKNGYTQMDQEKENREIQFEGAEEDSEENERESSSMGQYSSQQPGPRKTLQGSSSKTGDGGGLFIHK